MKVKVKVTPQMRETIEACRVIRKKHRRLTIRALGAALGLKYRTAQCRMEKLREAGLCPWQVGRQERPKRVVLQKPVTNGANVERADLSQVKAIRKAAYQGMADGRDQVDDPKDHGVAATPRSGRRQTPETTAEACRRMLREWRIMTGRQQPSPRIVRAPLLMVAHASSPYQRSAHRCHYSPQGIHR